jgi:Zn-finger nucleic acid-binding protein
MKLILEQRQFACEYCTTIYFPEEDNEGVRMLDEESQSICPVCRIPLFYGYVDWTQILYCRKCRGMLIDQETFSRAVEYLRAAPEGPPVEPPRMNPEELRRKIVCPECNRQMSTHPYGGPGNIILDNCINCDLIWLDHTELSRVVRAPGRDRGNWG